jgi:hypothetical protein
MRVRARLEALLSEGLRAMEEVIIIREERRKTRRRASVADEIKITIINKF